MKSIFLKTAVTAVLMGMTAVAFAAPGGGKGPPPGKGEDAGGNKLALPAILVGGPLSNFVCGTDGDYGDRVLPDGGEVATGYSIDETAFYFIQGDPDSPWQAACKQVAAEPEVNVFGAWGDNLVGDAKLKIGSPIRVEIVLYEGDTAGGMAAPTQDGWLVEKLEPSMLDRESPYGILAEDDSMGGYFATASPMTSVVYDRDAHLTISQPGATTPFVDEDIAPEINATGKIVYGYNLRVTELGKWVVSFTMPNLNFVGCDVQGLVCAGHEASIEIDVGTGGGGGGGKKGGE
jgi:hypothetical protein